MKNLIALTGFLAVAFTLIAPALAAEKKSSRPGEFWVYFGTYTRAESKGIYRARLDAASGKLSAAELAAECGNPSFLATHPNEKFLYAIDENVDPAKTPGRGVAAYAVEPGSGRLTLLNEQSNGGPGPCHLAVDASGQCVLVANYSGGSVAAIRLQPDGRLGASGSVVQHTGSSVNPARQKEPHAHAITLAPDGRYAFSPDLGIDKVMAYRVDAAAATLTPNTPPSAALAPGSGPRHMAFHPNGKFAYVINELLCTVAAFRYDARRGELQDLQTVSTLPIGETVQRGYSTAEIAVHPSGKFVYGSNRGHNTIAVFAVEAESGRLTLVQHQSTLGKTPRNFAIDPTGTWLLAENQGSGTVAVFRIDATTGKLTGTGQTLAVPNPVCAVFVAVK